MTTNNVMNFWLIRAEQKKRIVEEKKKVIVPPIYNQKEVDEICDQADWASRLKNTNYVI